MKINTPRDAGHRGGEATRRRHDELELLRAIEAYKARTGRQFPTYCEVFALVRQLGWKKG